MNIENRDDILQQVFVTLHGLDTSLNTIRDSLHNLDVKLEKTSTEAKSDNVHLRELFSSVDENLKSQIDSNKNKIATGLHEIRDCKKEIEKAQAQLKVLKILGGFVVGIAIVATCVFAGVAAF